MVCMLTKDGVTCRDIPRIWLNKMGVSDVSPASNLLPAMKTILCTFLSLSCMVSVGIATETTVTPDRLAQDQIETLVSPIALYPDALVALILPASTRPSDLVLAARFLQRGGSPEAVAAETWEDSVKALIRYPEVVTYLDENLAWTQTLGDAFLAQRADVMDAIQTVRARARASGLLTDTAEQQVLVEGGEICIVPARASVIYVPRYDPEILYVTYPRSYYPGPFISFGLGYSIGAWLSYDCDWRQRRVCIIHRSPGWYANYNWRARPDYRHSAGLTWRDWTPAHQHSRSFDHRSRATSNPTLRPNRSWDSQGHARSETQEQNRNHRNDRPQGIQDGRITSRPDVTSNTPPPWSTSGATTNQHHTTSNGATSSAVTAPATSGLAPPATQRQSPGTNPRSTGNDSPRGQHPDDANRSGIGRGDRTSATTPTSRVQPPSSPVVRHTETSSATSRSEPAKNKADRSQKSGDRDHQSDLP